MLKKAVITLATFLVLGIVAVLGIAATKPDTFYVQRSTTINASQEKIFPLINELRAQSSWSPFEKDPDMKRTLSGPVSGKGAVYAWDGNREVGAGSIAITDSVEPRKVTLALDMTRPFAAHNIVEFTLQPVGDATTVTWAMHGPQPFIGKIISTVIDCDKMVGAMFEEGLAKLKVLAEKQTTSAR